MSSSAQLEREADRTRREIFADLEELRTHMTPGHVVDQLVDYANDTTGGMFFRNLKRQAADNPLPVVMIGAGLGWLMLSGRRSPSDGSAQRFAGQTRSAVERAGMTAGRWAEETRAGASDLAKSVTAGASRLGDDTRTGASDIADRARAGMHDMRDSLSETADSAADRISSAYQSAADATSSAYEHGSDRVADAAARLQDTARGASDRAAALAGAATEQARRTVGAARGAASQIGHNVGDTGRGLMEFLRERPLVLVGLGVAVGALMGAMLPATTKEDELMGEASDDLKEGAAEFAGRQAERGAAVAEGAWQGAKEEAEQQHLPGFDHGRQAQSGEQREVLGPDESSLVPEAERKIERELSGA
jgi:hypothetical protein